MTLSTIRRASIVLLTPIGLIVGVYLIGWADCPTAGRPGGLCVNNFQNPPFAGILNSKAQEKGCNGNGWFWTPVAGGPGYCWTNRPADICIANAGTCCIKTRFYMLLQAACSGE